MKNQNHITKVLKKIEVGNPLYNLGLFKLLDDHDSTKNDEQLAKFYHHLLDCVEGSDVAENLAYAMIAYSTGSDVNPVFLEMQKIIAIHNN